MLKNPIYKMSERKISNSLQDRTDQTLPSLPYTDSILYPFSSFLKHKVPGFQLLFFNFACI